MRNKQMQATTHSQNLKKMIKVHLSRGDRARKFGLAAADPGTRGSENVGG
jgi:hypothetical protein